MPLWDDARSLVAGGDSDTALDLLEAFLKGRIDGPFSQRIRPLLDAAILLRARRRRLENDLVRGTITRTEYQAENAQLDHAILGLTRQVQQLDHSPSPPLSKSMPNLSALEKLMGTESHLRSTGWLAEGLRLASAVCRLTNDIIVGSGFLCRPDAVITNHHVIGDRGIAENFRAEFFFEEDAVRNLKTPTILQLAPNLLFWTSTELDITLIGLASQPPRDAHIIPIRRSAGLRVNERVSIIQHPNGGPKQIATTNNRVINVFSPYIHYTTDTLPGSSGSPVFRDSWEVVAIHHAGGDVRKNARGDVIFANEGILIAALLENYEFKNIYLRRN